MGRAAEYFDIMNSEEEYYPKSKNIQVLELKEFLHTMHEKGKLHKINYLGLLRFFPVMKKYKNRHMYGIF